MIKIVILDPSIDLLPEDNFDKVISDRANYVQCYELVAKAIHENYDFSLLIRDKVIGRWFKVMAKKYGPDQISIEELTIRKQLYKQIGIQIPERITDKQIETSDLLDLHIPAIPGKSFDDYVLETFFGEYLLSQYGLRRISQFVASYEKEQWEAALARPVVRDLYDRRLQNYQKQLEKQNIIGEKQLIDWLIISPDELLRKLFALRVLVNYPETIGKKVLGSCFPYLKTLYLDLRNVPSIVDRNEQLVDEIRLYLNKSLRGKNKKGILVSLLDEISGLLEIEFDTIFDLLHEGEIDITPVLIRRIRRTFNPIQEIPKVTQGLADLELLIRRELSEIPAQNWAEEKWLEWACDDYLPYRFWLENTGRLTDEIGEIANSFADWFYDQYGKLLYHSENMAWKHFSKLIIESTNQNQPVLAVIIDNLNAKFYPELLNQMQLRGFFQQELRYCFSGIPSCTEVSKRGLLIGHYAPFSSTKYKDVVESTWANKTGKNILYLSNIGELRAISECDHDLYILNYLPLDIRLHQSEAHTGISHSQAIRNYLSSLSQDIQAFSIRIGAERSLRVVFASDHGSTRIPRGALNVIDRKFYKDRSEDEHHRYIEILDKDIDTLPSYTKNECYLIKKDVYELESNYLVARKLYRFLPTDESVYVHGGLTPEETLVPVSVFEPVTTSPKPLAVQVVEGNKLFVGTRVDIRIEITNFNHYPCEFLTITTDDPNLDLGDVQLDLIPKLDRVEVVVSGRCSNSADTAIDQLAVEITYKFLGQPWKNLSYIPITIEAPAKPKFDLDNL